MSTIDILLIVSVIAFCFYGVYLGFKTMYDIRQRNIELFKKKRNQIRKELENG